MTTKEIVQYYESTKNRPVRDDLVFAIEALGQERVAIDCGCGAGSDIAFLRKNGFTVYAFDIERESIARCRDRFRGDSEVHLYLDSFTSFAYPSASLIVADAALFFCPRSEFDAVWKKMTHALPTNGIFCGSFLGPQARMASHGDEKASFWGDVLILTESEIREKLSDFEILKWSEHNFSGETAQGIRHHWHIFSVVAKRTKTA